MAVIITADDIQYIADRLNAMFELGAADIALQNAIKGKAETHIGGIIEAYVENGGLGEEPGDFETQIDGVKNMAVAKISTAIATKTGALGYDTIGDALTGLVEYTKEDGGSIGDLKIKTEYDAILAEISDKIGLFNSYSNTTVTDIVDEEDNILGKTLLLTDGAEEPETIATLDVVYSEVQNSFIAGLTPVQILTPINIIVVNASGLDPVLVPNGELGVNPELF